MSEFDPRTIPSFAELPQEQYGNYRPQPDGGFTAATVVDIEAAWSEVLTDQNVEAAQGLLQARSLELSVLTQEVGDRIDSEVEVGKSPGQVAALYSRRDRLTLAASLAERYREQFTIGAFIKRHAITEPVDRKFVAELCELIEEANNPAGRYYSDRELQDAALETMLFDLTIRNGVEAEH